MSDELTLPPTIERRNKMDVSLGYCGEIHPGRLASLGPMIELRVEGPEALIDFLRHDAVAGRPYFVNHLRSRGQEWEYVCFVRRGRWTMFAAILSTALAYNPGFGDGRRRRLACGGTRIIGKESLERAAHHPLRTPEEELLAALAMDLDLAEAMTGKNLSNGFNIGGSKTLVYVTELPGRWLVAPDEVRAFAGFMAEFHNSITASLPVFIGTGSDLNFHEHGDRYYDLASRLSPSYFGDHLAASRWGRATTGNTTAPTAAGVLACVDAVIDALALGPADRSILIKGLGGIGAAVARHYVARGFRVYATEVREAVVAALKAELAGRVEFVAEERWGELAGVSLFSPNAASGSLTRENLPVLQRIGVRAVVGGENNIRDKGLDADTVYRDFGILTFADFLLNGGGAWIVDAEMVERPVENVHEWIRVYQVPAVLHTIRLARERGRSPEAIYREFIDRKVKELLA